MKVGVHDYRRMRQNIMTKVYLFVHQAHWADCVVARNDREWTRNGQGKLFLKNLRESLRKKY